MWFKNLKVFRLKDGFNPTADDLYDAIEKHAFKPGSSLQMVRIGWVPVHDDLGLVYGQNGHFMIVLREEKKILPPSVINQAAKARALQIEEQQGYKPGRKQMKEIKEQVTDDLLPKAFSSYRDTRVWIDTVNRWLVIDTTASAKSDQVLGMLAKSFDPFPVAPFHVEMSPAGAMTSWLIDNEPPASFSIDQDTELRSTSQTRAAVRYVRQSIESEDARKHVEAGKQCARLAMTWADRVSFVLTDTLDIKRVCPLDVLRENNDLALSQAEVFDSDFALMTGELSRMLADLVGVLGGEKQPF